MAGISVRMSLTAAAALLWVGCGGEPADDNTHVPPSVRPEGQREFVTTLGNDTITVESFVRSPDRIQGVYVNRSPQTVVARYSAHLTPDERIDRLSIEWSTPSSNPEGMAPWTSTITVEGTTATVVNEGGPADGTTEMEVPEGAIPTLGRLPLALFVAEQAGRQARAAGADEYPVSLVSSTRPQPTENTITAATGDTLSYVFFGNPMYFVLSQGGEIMGADGYATTMSVVASRSDHLDVPILAVDFAARDARGEGLGVPSPAATATTAIGGARIEVAYSQPAKRGRKIWGGLVPYGEVWRTGANSATLFTTDSDLILRDRRVPAGSYTLWTLFTESSQELIVNRQTGQWGTEYDESRDFARIPMTVEPLGQVAERFTISFQETRMGGVMHLDWDKTRFSVPIRVP